MVKCCLCQIPKEDDIQYGELLRKGNMAVHTFCLYLSSNLCQNGTDDQGFLGFLKGDIKKEASRGSKLKCYVCLKSNASIGCCDRSCRKSFHFICGIEKGCENQFSNTYKSYCHKHRRKDRTKKSPAEKDLCSICYEDFCGVSHSRRAIESPCCHSGWFHKYCLQKFAKTAGYFFKCPLCNNSQNFRQHLLAEGIFIPDQDAAWELEPNAFAELLERPSECSASTCKYRKERTASREYNPFIFCRTCGSIALHKLCLPRGQTTFLCSDCTNAAKDHDSGHDSFSSPNQNHDEFEEIDVCNVSDKEDLDLINRMLSPNQQDCAEDVRDSSLIEERESVEKEIVLCLQKKDQRANDCEQRTSGESNCSEARNVSKTRNKLRNESEIFKNEQQKSEAHCLKNEINFRRRKRTQQLSSSESGCSEERCKQKVIICASDEDISRVHSPIKHTQQRIESDCLKKKSGKNVESNCSETRNKLWSKSEQQKSEDHCSKNEINFRRRKRIRQLSSSESGCSEERCKQKVIICSSDEDISKVHSPIKHTQQRIESDCSKKKIGTNVESNCSETRNKLWSKSEQQKSEAHCLKNEINFRRRKRTRQLSSSESGCSEERCKQKVIRTQQRIESDCSKKKSGTNVESNCSETRNKLWSKTEQQISEAHCSKIEINFRRRIRTRHLSSSESGCSEKGCEQMARSCSSNKDILNQVKVSSPKYGINTRCRKRIRQLSTESSCSEERCKQNVIICSSNCLEKGYEKMTQAGSSDKDTSDSQMRIWMQSIDKDIPDISKNCKQNTNSVEKTNGESYYSEFRCEGEYKEKTPRLIETMKQNKDNIISDILNDNGQKTKCCFSDYVINICNTNSQLQISGSSEISKENLNPLYNQHVPKPNKKYTPSQIKESIQCLNDSPDYDEGRGSQRSEDSDDPIENFKNCFKKNINEMKFFEISQKEASNRNSSLNKMSSLTADKTFKPKTNKRLRRIGHLKNVDISRIAKRMRTKSVICESNENISDKPDCNSNNNFKDYVASNNELNNPCHISCVENRTRKPKSIDLRTIEEPSTSSSSTSSSVGENTSSTPGWCNEKWPKQSSDIAFYKSKFRSTRSHNDNRERNGFS